MSEATFTKDDIGDIIAKAVSAAIAATNAPAPPTDQEKAALAARQEERRTTAEGIAAKKASDRHFAEFVCAHEHSRAAGGGTHCVYVRDNDHPQDPGFILCQACQGRVRPDTPKWRKLDPEAIFDTHKFNTLFQQCSGGHREMID